jgi:UV DNA damage endonuclease
MFFKGLLEMKIGYPCINRTIDCKGDKTFRLKSYSEQRLKETIENNLNCLNKMLDYNSKRNILFFRISSDLIPFASHPICKYNWQEEFKDVFIKIGEFIRKKKMRISMHPDQFIVLNSPNSKIVQRAIKELEYHTAILDLLNLDKTAKIQLHIGGAYNDKNKSIKRFAKVYNRLSEEMTNRLVIENDDRSYDIKDCLKLHQEINVPILFDYHHFQILNKNEIMSYTLSNVMESWEKNDGIPMFDYSSQKPNERKGAHAEHIDLNDFTDFILKTKPFDFDVMLEIKDKEASALKAIKILKNDSRFIKM